MFMTLLRTVLSPTATARHGNRVWGLMSSALGAGVTTVSKPPLLPKARSAV
jgi:hypothetical protein